MTDLCNLPAHFTMVTFHLETEIVKNDQAPFLTYTCIFLDKKASSMKIYNNNNNKISILIHI